MATKKNTILGYIAGLLSSVFGQQVQKPDVNNIREKEFSTSTQKMGFTFTEKIRNIFRFKWIK